MCPRIIISSLFGQCVFEAETTEEVLALHRSYLQNLMETASPIPTGETTTVGEGEEDTPNPYSLPNGYVPCSLSRVLEEFAVKAMDKDNTECGCLKCKPGQYVVIRKLLWNELVSRIPNGECPQSSYES